MTIGTMIGIPQTAYAGQGILDGKTFIGPTGMQGSSEVEEQDEVQFNNGDFLSVGCVE
ncbi:hypothetical protein H0A36_27230 [Endozoicomonas sp. SM1973]|uniref:Uncharacterized protein n=1 Tax=Spartinivicinus marinus TaxID=2994442 RepID=A0A853ICX5_9GAMM|nr:hypothetical protein [Spartinivicinus marinus]NYZ69712.1 hypothetical protein [Spartinivicinus marinus]